jgi:hypothetical protein
MHRTDTDPETVMVTAESFAEEVERTITRIVERYDGTMKGVTVTPRRTNTGTIWAHVVYEGTDLSPFINWDYRAYNEIESLTVGLDEDLSAYVEDIDGVTAGVYR